MPGVETNEEWLWLRAWPSPRRHPWSALAWCWELFTGILALVLCLCVLASFPIAHFWVLGYLLDAGARVASSGRVLQMFPLLPVARRVVVVAIAIWSGRAICEYFGKIVADAHLIAGYSLPFWIALTGCGFILAAAISYLLASLAHGGSCISYFRLLRNLRWLISDWRSQTFWKWAADSTFEFWAAIDIRRRFLLGIGGYLIAWTYHRACHRTAAAWCLTWPCALAVCVGLCFYVWLLAHTPLAHYRHPMALIHHTLILPLPNY